MKILNYGSLNIDLVYRLDHLVLPGETQAAERFDRFCGGKGLNQSIALARAGAKTLHAGKVGPDGEMLLSALREAGVDVSPVTVGQEPSGHAVIQVERSGQNAILIYPGANGAIGATEFKGYAADGYNIAVHTFPLIMMNTLTGKDRYSMDDFEYLAISNLDVAVLLTRKESPHDTFSPC